MKTNFNSIVGVGVGSRGSVTSINRRRTVDKPEPTEFQAELRQRIVEYINKAKRAGTVAMSEENLWACVKPPPETLAGAPLGTNMRYYYRQLFTETVATIPQAVKFTKI